MLTIIEQVGILGIMILAGFVIVKTGYVDINIKDSISKILVKVILPCLVITSVTSKTFDSSLANDIFITILLTVVCIAFLFLCGVVTAKIFKVPDASRSVHKLLFALGNVIFIGLPVIQSVYGEESVFYTIIYWLINDMVLWTIGIIMFTKNTGSKKEFFKKLINPNTVSFIIAIVMFLLKIKLPGFLFDAVSGIGNLTIPLSMIFIGMTLAGIDIKTALKKWWVAVIIPVKMILIPILLIYIFKFLNINEVILGVVVIEAAMPSQTVLSILAYEHNADSVYASTSMFFTTIISLFTLPFVCYMLKVML